tara:strand:+ start:1053 stop:2063 length:1011 start_codon:yes stop_codon:yes gene_type:complete
LLVNLGSPKSLNLNDIKSYLNEFLSDDLVIDLPKPIQQFIIKFLILPFRSPKTKSAYEKIWEKNGSPLIDNTRNIAKALEKNTDWKVDIAMRYQYPSILECIQKYKKLSIKELIILPLYPHNAISTTLSAEIKIKEVINTIYPELDLIYVKPFFNNKKYIEALSETIKPHLNKIDKLIFSYHGIPERHLYKGDMSKQHCLKVDDCCNMDCFQSNHCYRSNVFTTAKLCAQYLNIKDNKWSITFQSRLSIIDPKWLRPYTDLELKKLPKQGYKKIAIICPSFVADCLETLEEINITGRKIFLESGGEDFIYIPCLNNDEIFVSALKEMIVSAKNNNI